MVRPALLLAFFFGNCRSVWAAQSCPNDPDLDMCIPTPSPTASPTESPTDSPTESPTEPTTAAPGGTTQAAGTTQTAGGTGYTTQDSSVSVTATTLAPVDVTAECSTAAASIVGLSTDQCPLVNAWLNANPDKVSVAQGCFEAKDVADADCVALMAVAPMNMTEMCEAALTAIPQLPQNSCPQVLTWLIANPSSIGAGQACFESKNPANVNCISLLAKYLTSSTQQSTDKPEGEDNSGNGAVHLHTFAGVLIWLPAVLVSTFSTESMHE